MVFKARMSGVCRACGLSYPAGTEIEKSQRHGWVHAGRCPKSKGEAQQQADALLQRETKANTSPSTIVNRDGAEWFSLPYRYDVDFISTVKSLPHRFFDSSSKTWFCSAVDFAQAVKALAHVDKAYAESMLHGEQFALAREASDRVSARVEASRASTSTRDLPRPAGLDYLPYQKAGIEFALDRKDILIGDEPGLGKTIQALGIINTDESIRTVLIVCPASLRLNWRDEASKWLTRQFQIHVVDGTKVRTTGQKKPTGWPDLSTGNHVVVCNYDVVSKHPVHSTEWDLLILDESHYLKNPKTARTKAIFGKWDRDPAKVAPAIRARRRVALTGTPIPNRPIELWPLVQALDPQGLGRSWKRFAERYCAAYQSRWGWDVSGASHLDELQRAMRGSFMVRRLKAQVLTELPAKRRQIIVLPQNGASGAVKAEQEALEAQQKAELELQVRLALAKASGSDRTYAEAVEALRAFRAAMFDEMARLRHETALAKVPYVVEYVKGLAGAGKVVLFAHHRDVIEALVAGLEASDGDDEGLKTVVVTGSTSLDDRHAAVQSSQNDSSVRVFIGNIQAAGVGLTLTAASQVVFAELDWVPGNMSQAEDRCHHISQHEMVLVTHLVLEDSLDEVMAKTLVRKQAIADSALDKRHASDSPADLAVAVANGNEASEAEGFTVELHESVAEQARRRDERAAKAEARAAAQEATRERLQAVAKELTAEQIEAIHECLRALAGVCDYARAKDGMGFNTIDTHVGHELATRAALEPAEAALGREILIKYGSQLEAYEMPYRAALGAK